MLDVFITVDTEIWPEGMSSDGAEFQAAYQRHILGQTRQGQYGIPLQLKIMNEHGIKSTFFVESLFASAAGIGPLADIVGMIQSAGHNVESHVHAEWARMVPQFKSIFNGGRNLAGYSEDEQYAMLGAALENLDKAGAEKPRAFRAGNYGADISTLRAVQRHGIPFDSSYNYCYLHRDCSLYLPEPFLQPAPVEGIIEVPISFFSDWPGHYRHAQLTACSFGELRNLLERAVEQGWTSVVIVSHSFELLNPGCVAPDSIVTRRFEKLCAYIAENSDRMRARGFQSLQADEAVPAVAKVRPLESNLLNTGLRYAEQMVRRIPRRSQLV